MTDVAGNGLEDLCFHSSQHKVLHWKMLLVDFVQIFFLPQVGRAGAAGAAGGEAGAEAGQGGRDLPGQARNLPRQT